SLQGLYFRSRLTAANTPIPGSPGNELTSDGIGLGYTLGLTLTPFQGTRIGVGYRSGVKEDLDGHLTLEGPPGLLPAGRYPIETKITLPDMLTVGLEQSITDRFKLLAGYEFTHWSKFDSFPVLFTSGPGAGSEFTSLAFKYDDGHYFAIGGE